MALFASWVHGHAGRIEAPDRLVNIVPIGWGLQVAGLPGTDNWLHYAVPTPVIVNGVRAKIVQLGIKATRQSTDARIWAVPAYDGHHRFYANESVPDLAIVTNPPGAEYPGTFLVEEPASCNSQRAVGSMLATLPIAASSIDQNPMASSSRGRVTHCVAGAFVLLVSFGVAPSSARASCGRDVISNQSRSTGKSAFDLELLRDPITEPIEPESGNADNDRPCSGPSCSRGRDLPRPPAPSVESTDTSEPWCCTVVARCWGSSREPSGTMANLPAAQPRHSTSPLERPPRCAMALS
jgi:hypothetical protein